MLSLPHEFTAQILPIIGRTCVVYVFILIGLKCIGRRALRGMGPQELFLITLLAKVVGDHVVPPQAGIGGNVVAGLTLFTLISIVDRIPMLKKWVEGTPIVVYEHGAIQRKELACNLLSEADLERTARDYGRETMNDFETITLEKDGRLTGVLKQAHEQSDIRSVKSQRL
jgi:uncharacterized membrane protein YcaP (DUF421 family)